MVVDPEYFLGRGSANLHNLLVTLRLCSGLGTPLRAETLWGHICWGIRYRSGSEFLKEWLSQYDADAPPLVLSDPVPHGFLPRPRLPSPRASSTRPLANEAARRKDINRRTLISAQRMMALQTNLTSDGLLSAITEDSSVPAASTEVSITQAGINRLTGGTEQPEGGALYTSPVRFYRSPGQNDQPLFDVYVRSTQSQDIVENWFRDGLSGGYGRDAATGRGDLQFHSISPWNFKAHPQANAVMLLGPAVPRQSDPTRGYFVSGGYSGRVGGDFAVEDTPDGSGIRQKYPVHYLQAGSVLICKTAPDGSRSVPTTIGRILRDVHPWSEIRHYGISLSLPLTLDERLLNSAF